MKMLDSDLVALQAAVVAVLDRFPLAMRDYHERGLSGERFRWDVLHASGFDTGVLYKYLSDSHIDTALRHIVSAWQARP